MVVNPYNDLHNNNVWIRTFDKNVSEGELVWHRDREDRIIEVLEGKGWSFQRDNELPFKLNVGDVFEIDQMVYHRLLKGTTSLKIRIIEKS